MVEIVELDRGFTQFVWLCKPCKEARERDGYHVKGSRPLPYRMVNGKPERVELECQDCPKVAA